MKSNNLFQVKARSHVSHGSSARPTNEKIPYTSMDWKIHELFFLKAICHQLSLPR